MVLIIFRSCRSFTVHGMTNTLGKGGQIILNMITYGPVTAYLCVKGIRISAGNFSPSTQQSRLGSIWLPSLQIHTIRLNVKSISSWLLVWPSRKLVIGDTKSNLREFHGIFVDNMALGKILFLSVILLLLLHTQLTSQLRLKSSLIFGWIH